MGRLKMVPERRDVDRLIDVGLARLASLSKLRRSLYAVSVGWHV